MLSRRISSAIITSSILAASLLHLLPSQAKPAPTSGKVLKLTSGDLMCYVDLATRSKKYVIGASFEICEQTQFLNKQVKLTYKSISVNDCQSAEPCGKTRPENAIVKMKLLRSK